MMTIALAALCLMAPVQTSLHWPLVPDPHFAINGIDANGAAQLAHATISIKADPLGNRKQVTDASGTSATMTLPPGSSTWKTLQIAFTYSADGTLAKFGGISLVVKGGHLWFKKDDTKLDVAPLLADDFNDVQIIKHYNSLLAYVNGARASLSILPTKPLLPLEVGLDTWKGTIIGVAGYPRELTVDEMFANENAAHSLAKSLFADTPKFTVEGELLAATPIPDIEKIRPYRSALLAEEYKVVRIVSGRASAIKPGMKIRIFRWGIRAGEKTEVKNAKIGDHHDLLIQRYDSDPKFEREFQLDNLDPDISIPLFVDVTPDK